MSEQSRQVHWDTTYSSKGELNVSWFEDQPQVSLDLIAQAGASPDCALIDIGGGASRLVDALLAADWHALTVLDLSAVALAAARARLGDRADKVDWIVADVTHWRPDRSYDIWHDRAAFHFLTEQGDRDAYLERLHQALKTGGHAIIATFAPDGPERCSGLPVVRYDPATLAEIAGSSFRLIAERRHVHMTPWGSSQSFQFSLLQKI